MIYNILLHMPISIDRFDDQPSDALSIEEGSQPQRILAFLAAHDEQAFTQTEIHEETEIPRGSVGVVLSRLEDRGLIRHRGRYWAIAEDDRLASYAAQWGASSSSTTDDYYGEQNG
jgi:predicted transcriptional regulator of viral defense system